MLFMPDLNDFYAFKMTSGGDSYGGGNVNGYTVFWIILIIVGVLWLIGKIFG